MFRSEYSGYILDYIFLIFRSFCSLYSASSYNMPRQSKRTKLVENEESKELPVTEKRTLPSLSELIKDGQLDEDAIERFANEISRPELQYMIGQDFEGDELLSLLLLVVWKAKVDNNFMLYFDRKPEKFSTIVEFVVCHLGIINTEVACWKHYVLVRFFVESFAHLDQPLVRSTLLRFVSLPCWVNLSKECLDYALSLSPTVTSNWTKLQTLKEKFKKDKRKTSNNQAEESLDKDEKVLFNTVKSCFSLLSSTLDKWGRKCVISILELLTLILSNPTTRKYFSVLLDDMHFTTICSILLENSFHEDDKKYITPWLNLVIWFSSISEPVSSTKDLVLELQRIAFTEFPDKLQDIMYSSYGTISDKGSLSRIIRLLGTSEIIHIARRLCLWTSLDNLVHPDDRELALRLIVDKVCAKQSPYEAFVHETVYPTEHTLFDDNLLPLQHSATLQHPIPKLNLQYINLLDYLQRCYQLYRLESAYEIREDIVDALRKMQPKQALSGSVGFTGWCSMATPISQTNIEKVSKAKIGETYPSRVVVSITIDFASFVDDFRTEWEELRENDVLYLVAINKPRIAVSSDVTSLTNFVEEYGVRAIRGGQIIEMRDEANNLLNHTVGNDEPAAQRVGTKRKIKLALDPRQYFEDISGGNNCYESFNLLIRRNPRENNFKAVLDTIRSLGRKKDIEHDIPDFVRDLLLGISDPRSSTYNWDLISGTVSTKEFTLDYCDTFQDLDHVRASFVGAIIEVSDEHLSPPYTLRVTVTSLPPTAAPSSSSCPEISSTIGQKRGRKSKAPAQEESTSGVESKDVSSNTTDLRISHVRVTSSHRPPSSPYMDIYGSSEFNNKIRFTPKQVEAITSGMQEKMTVLIGPPGTGKTDVAVQIIANLYQQYPTQKILVVTHSNAALNDIFAKIMAKVDVDPCHLLRLGSGERDLRENIVARTAQQKAQQLREQLELENTFSKTGRVNWSLTRRLQLLTQVQQLALSLRVFGDYGTSCEQAEYFFVSQIKPRMEQFNALLTSETKNQELLVQVFPFRAFFPDLPVDMWQQENIFERCMFTVHKIFQELRDYRAFELMRSHTLRGDYLLTKQARIVAMTCKHAAIIRHRLIEQGFHYDSLIVEEAAQILEIETLIPMVLQQTDTLEACRLKRVVLLGDHHQLTPIVRHPYLRSYANMEQSMFARFVNLGFPSVVLDKQGRARRELASLFAWRYSTSSHPLGNLPNVMPHEENGMYAVANAGFAHTHQFVEVDDFQGKGEDAISTSYQNLGEAEYVVAVYQYMRLLGYPAERISILTTYRAQVQLIRGLLKKRCGNVLFGMPAHVSTVDRFQGQQNDYILLSLVRTRSIGHISDIRRLVVAISRARLGLYVFGRYSLFASVPEVSEVMQVFSRLSTKLQLIAGEAFPSNRPISHDDSPKHTATASSSEATLEMDGVTNMGVLVYQMVQQAQLLQQQSPMDTSV